jgi:DNA-binding NarL/FixJ family response regulator
VLVKDYIRMKELEQYSKLTTAEKNVLALLEKGESRTQIIEKLVISESTLKNQITQILKKFKVKTGKEVITIIKRRGL